MGGLAFSFDATQQAIEFERDADQNAIGVETDGERVRSLAITDENGAIADVIVRNGQIVGDPDREIRLVTLNFLAGGGDAYPFPLFGENQFDLVDEALPAGATNNANFTDNGSEQDALAEFLSENFPANGNPSFARRDVPPERDQRIQNLSVRQDTVLNQTLVGGAADDTIIDGLDNDSLYGRGGDDILQGRAGSDHLFGAAGDNTLRGGQGRVRVSVA